MDKPLLKGRMTLVGLVVVFALPALIAKLILSQNWYQSGVTNFGQLIDGNVTLSSLGIESSESQEGWLLGYVIPEHCDELCTQQMHILGQSYIALGKYKERVSPTIFATKSSDSNWLESHDADALVVSEVNERVFQDASIIIVDPLGQLVMLYPSVTNESELVSQSKGMLHDLRKLLKLSRVG
ncbi:hypothetical protein L4C33_13325 [Vibrio makurazakiensis]|uniref:hypothetical protein n=1 Tax=Vibrio makurazakiensis TaxID=2910250 RepID=UPI003D1049E4